LGRAGVLDGSFKGGMTVKLSMDAITQNLRDAGCQENFIKGFLASLIQDTPAEQERMLEKERRCILEKIHEEQRKLDRFDYLRYALKKSRSE